VTCGSAIKLSHYESKTQTYSEQHFLSSEGEHQVAGTGLQIVTAVTDPTTTDTLWWIRGPNDPESRGTQHGGRGACANDGTAEKIPCGSMIRLTHLNTKKNLSSHNKKSPLSQQQEVFASGQGHATGNNGDDWEVVCTTKFWRREERVQFHHVDTDKYLGASSTVKFTHQNCGHNCPIMNHLEVFGRGAKDDYSIWIVKMGVHLSR
jgi:dolichyl-phosphate-mannose--protein O-mannosyl transferase